MSNIKLILSNYDTSRTHSVYIRRVLIVWVTDPQEVLKC